LRDQRKRDFSPTLLDFGPLRIYLARHFGFCYGVENAIEISYRALEENAGRRVFLLSQMIHNPEVNRDLEERGISFIMDTDGTMFTPWEQIGPDDIVIIPAFGTTLETEQLLLSKGVEIQRYNTTCPFVEKVWNRAAKLGRDNYTVIIHGKPAHEETRATFSHSSAAAPSIIIRNMDEARRLAAYILEEEPAEKFFTEFRGRHSPGFRPEQHLVRVGVVNQTTMLATETQAIADFFRSVMIRKYGEDSLHDHFADTRDTLCYATNDNQEATYALLETEADLALVIGGYNSSNTSHIAELCARKFPTYFINSDKEIISPSEIHHWNYQKKQKETSHGWLPTHRPVQIVLTSGASCPDTLVDRVMIRLVEFFPEAKPVESVIRTFLKTA
jgi:4-hydroxy-3-methylbut-2-enyl diphosphate reductase